MSRVLILLYGIVGYALFFATFLYLIGFVTGYAVPVTVDEGGPVGPLWPAILADVGLIGLFALQHTIMARTWFKRAIERWIPQPIERTTFVIATSAVFILMFAFWRPIPTVIWSVDGAPAMVILAVAAAGWLLVLLSTFQIDHFELFGLRQTWLAFRGKEWTPTPFVERGAYRVVRHPLMLGFLIAMWATPTMTGGHLVLSSAFTVYVLLGVAIEERDLIRTHGETYLDYRRRVPGLIPGLRFRPGQRQADPA